jgi:D-alanyl-lipoteichoic acid acyltransferase DltB (MBOAT superfamily)
MLFNSTQYAVFFPIVVALYFMIPHRFRWVFLLVSSYYFYMCWKPGYAVLIIITTLVDYAAGLLMESAESRVVRRRYLILSLCSNLGMLFFFKYYNFFNESLRILTGKLDLGLSLPASSFLLPVGLSFYTFQSLTYTIGVYRGTVKAERHLGILAAYVCFFPQLVAGPIERAQNLLPQFCEKHHFEYDRVTDGLKLMVWGLFKKSVIADRLAQLVDQVYDHPTEYQGMGLAIATVFFAFQIYCDFSGYSDMAIGGAQVLGFRLMDNFRRPYFATSVGDFWHRWHISLSTWFRDYLYIPLGGNRVSQARWVVNIMIVFALSGLWHGAHWKFLVWGALHGSYMIASRLSCPVRERIVAMMRLTARPRLRRALQMLMTFSLVTFAWIFFRANSISDGFYIIRNLFTGWDVVFDASRLSDVLFSLGLPRDEFLLAVAMVAVLLCGDLLQSLGDVRRTLARRPLMLRWTAYSALLWIIFLFGVFRHREFIYFTF